MVQCIFIVCALVSQCTYRCVVLPDRWPKRPPGALSESLNAPTGAWCSLTTESVILLVIALVVSMHLQVRGAP